MTTTGLCHTRGTTLLRLTDAPLFITDVTIRPSNLEIDWQQNGETAPLVIRKIALLGTKLFREGGEWKPTPWSRTHRLDQASIPDWVVDIVDEQFPGARWDIPRPYAAVIARQFAAKDG